MDEEKILSTISDGNVEKLRRANEVLRTPPWKQRPGSRPDGGMAQQSGIEELLRRIQQHESEVQNALADARRLVDNFEDEQIRLESEIAQLKAQLDAEKAERQHYEARCEELKNVLRAAAEIMVNGEKAKT